MQLGRSSSYPKIALVMFNFQICLHLLKDGMMLCEVGRKTRVQRVNNELGCSMIEMNGIIHELLFGEGIIFCANVTLRVTLRISKRMI